MGIAGSVTEAPDDGNVPSLPDEDPRFFLPSTLRVRRWTFNIQPFPPARPPQFGFVSQKACLARPFFPAIPPGPTQPDPVVFDPTASLTNSRDATCICPTLPHLPDDPLPHFGRFGRFGSFSTGGP